MAEPDGTLGPLPMLPFPPHACNIEPRTEFDEERYLGGSIPEGVSDNSEVEDVPVGFSGLGDRQGLPDPPRPHDCPGERAPINSPIQSEDINVLRTGPVSFVLTSRVAGQDPKQIVESLALEIIEHVHPHSAVAIRRTTPPEPAGEIVN